MVDEEKLAYLAGIIDGEGTIAILKRRKETRKTIVMRSDSYQLQVFVTNTNEDLMVWLLNTFGGSKSHHKGDKRNPNSKRWFVWYVSGYNAIKILRKIEPYLIIKHKNAEVAFEFYERCIKRSRHGVQKPKWLVDKSEMYYQEMKALNKTGVNNVEHTHKPSLKNTSPLHPFL